MERGSSGLIARSGTERVVSALLGKVGVEINGSNPWDIRVEDGRFYARVLREKSLGFGESYMEGWWECERLDELITRILKGGLERVTREGLFLLAPLVLDLLLNRQSRRRSELVADLHYNIGNDLFFAFLDPLKQYSCGYFNGTEDLAEAQQRKCELICRKLELKATDHVLDIGCGWGGLSRYAVERYGCRVTGVNIAREQIVHARANCRNLPVRIIEADYRDIGGEYDKVVSVGMFEHVGHKNYRRFMEVVHRCLNPRGIFLLHTIGSNVSERDVEPWFGKYIFPGGMLPSMTQISKAAEGLFVLEDLHNLGPHYDKTLMAWHANFRRSWESMKGLRARGEPFRRMWEYYLLSSAGAFRSRVNQLWQLVFTVQGRHQPDCRLS
jgi:cyclopropane-fatty-acyl-phospholipid synthase